MAVIIVSLPDKVKFEFLDVIKKNGQSISGVLRNLIIDFNNKNRSDKND